MKKIQLIRIIKSLNILIQKDNIFLIDIFEIQTIFKHYFIGYYCDVGDGGDDGDGCPDPDA